jgi:hypothetical protein
MSLTENVRPALLGRPWLLTEMCALVAGYGCVGGVSPFPIMGGAWAAHIDLVTDLPSRGDMVVGNDVWIGGNATIMPGVHIAHSDAERVREPDVPDHPGTISLALPGEASSANHLIHCSRDVPIPSQEPHPASADESAGDENEARIVGGHDDQPGELNWSREFGR